MALLSRAIKLHQDGRIEAAEREYQEILGENPDEPDALHLLGVIRQQQGRHEEAKELIGLAIAANPTQAVYHCNHGAALLSLQRYAEAEASFHRALSIRPSYADALANLGMAQAATDNELDAEISFRRALDSQTWHRDATIRLARLLQQQNRLEDASELLEAALQAAPCAQFHLALGNVRHAGANAEQAAEHFRHAILTSVVRREPEKDMPQRLVYDRSNETLGPSPDLLKASAGNDDCNTRRIAFVSPHCLLDFTNGAATATLDGLKLLRAVGFECEVFCGTRVDSWTKDSLQALLEARGEPYTIHDAQVGSFHGRIVFTSHCDIPITLVDSPATGESLINREEIAAFVTGCEIFMDTARPDVLWTYGGDAVTLVVQQMARRRNIPILFGLHNFSYRDDAPFQMADHVAVPSEFSRQHYRRTLGLDCHVLPYLVDPNRVSSHTLSIDQSGQLPPDDGSTKFVAFVNPQYEKGLFIFARIAVELARRRPKIPLLVVEGRAATTWKTETGIDLSRLPNVTIRPSTADPRTFYACTKLLLVSSLWDESFGLVAAEAMANGIPVLASRRGALPETIGNAGILFDVPVRYTPQARELPSVEDVAPWVETIIRLWDDKEEYVRVSQAASDRAQQWLPDRLAPLYRDFFSSIGHHSGAPLVTPEAG